MKVLALVPARGGSKGLPGKNIRPLYGKPLITWTIDAAKKSHYIHDVIVSTDDPEIADVAHSAGADVPFLRPAYLSSDSASVIDAIFHAIDHSDKVWDYVVLLQPTSPLRQSADIDDAFSTMLAKGASSIVSTTSLHKPQRFLTIKQENERLKLWIDKAGLAEEPPVIEMLNGAVYISAVDNLRKHKSFISKDTLTHPMAFERSWDIDSIFDFMICEMMMPYVLNDSHSLLKAVRA